MSDAIYAVHSAYGARDGARVFLKRRKPNGTYDAPLPSPYPAAESFNEGDSVILRDGRAVRAGR